MANRWQLTIVALIAILAAPSADADIYRWDNGEVIPGTEGIEPGPGVDLSHMDLRSARLNGKDLTGANLEGANLANASLLGSNLTDANLIGTNLTSVNLYNATLMNADLTNALLTGLRVWLTRWNMDSSRSNSTPLPATS